MAKTHADYNPSLLLKNGHLNTLYSALTRRKPFVKFSRTRIDTHDQDFLDLDFIIKDPKKIVLLCHGLEGSSESKYIQGTSLLFSENGYSVCAMNYRFCSGEINKTPQLYHSGFTVDLHTVISYLEDRFDEIHLCGFSLGGNLVLKYAGERGSQISSAIKSICAVSAPLDLYTSSLEIMKFQNYIYTQRFLVSLFKKLEIKHIQFPDHFDLSYKKKIKNVFDFDEYYTGPLNGFRDAKDYYSQSSSNQFLSDISIPTLIINAKDDPFLSEDCFPLPDYYSENQNITTLYPKYGGHCGFYLKGMYCWDELEILKFVENI